jgi:drug/metabolite transporter (DMT)-like permease
METLLRSRFGGIVLMTMAALAFSVNVVCVKFVSAHLPTLEVIFFRSFLGLIFTTGYMLSKKISFVGTHHRFLLSRGFFGFCALSLHFLTIAHMPLGTAVTLNYTAPIFTAILAVLLLKERPNSVVLVMTIVSFVGVWLLVGPGSVGNTFYAALALFSGILVSFVTLSIRAMRNLESPLTIIFYFVAISTLLTAPFMPSVFIWPSAREWLAVLAIGVATFYAQIWLTVALHHSPATLVSPFSYFTPVFSFLFGLIFWNEKVATSIIIGAVLIIFSGVMICLKEAALESVEE